ncbi:thioesterase family protein [Nocardia halotolerans]|uniref:Thioesterase family protein n=1 Tax=Nocardia halotolerans TaxID=1755878 RepID=A0ABV8VER5_9NOCA
MLTAGLRAAFDVEVTARDTAAALGSGDVEVLGTPRVVALVEEATVCTVAGQLPDGHTTVGTEVSIRHRRSSAPGTTLTVTARLIEVDGLRLTFDVAVHDDGFLVADGTVRRVIVDRASFPPATPRRG